MAARMWGSSSLICRHIVLFLLTHWVRTRMASSPIFFSGEEFDGSGGEIQAKLQRACGQVHPDIVVGKEKALVTVGALGAMESMERLYPGPMLPRRAASLRPPHSQTEPPQFFNRLQLAERSRICSLISFWWRRECPRAFA